MKKVIFSVFLFFLIIQGMAQDITLPLWPDGAPDSTKVPGKEHYYVKGFAHYDNISKAELYVYLPDKAKSTGAAVVICPGGGYWVEAIEHEGFMIAQYLKEQGIAGIVLKYRLPYGNPDVPVSDVHRAMRLVRSKAAQWNLNPDKIGVAGASAGGHLASTAGTHFDLGDTTSADPIERLSDRPDFMLLLYPVISFDEKIGHMGSRINFLGKTNDWKKVVPYSNEYQVTDQTPPCFLVLADDDHTVDPENSIRFYQQLRKHHVPAELHIFAKGGHGFGMKKINQSVEQWPHLFIQWLQAMKFTPPSQ